MHHESHTQSFLNEGCGKNLPHTDGSKTQIFPWKKKKEMALKGIQCKIAKTKIVFSLQDYLQSFNSSVMQIFCNVLFKYANTITLNMHQLQYISKHKAAK